MTAPPLETERLRMAVRAANIGLWDWDLATNQVYYSREWKGQIGYEDHEIANHFHEWQSRVHPDDVEGALRTVQAYLAHPTPSFRQEFRLRHKDGSYRWILAHGSLLCDERGTPVRMLGAHVDITGRKQAEADRRQVLERVTDAFVALDTKWRYTYVYPPARRGWRSRSSWCGAESAGGVCRGGGRAADWPVRRLVRHGGLPQGGGHRGGHRHRSALGGVQGGGAAARAAGLLWSTPIFDASRRVRQELVGLIQRSGGSLRDVEVAVRARNGSLLHVLLSADIVSLGGVPHRLTTLLDITEREQAGEAILRANEQLRALSRRLLEIQETERRHLARGLHDEIGQALTATRINLARASACSAWRSAPRWPVAASNGARRPAGARKSTHGSRWTGRRRSEHADPPCRRPRARAGRSSLAAGKHARGRGRGGGTRRPRGADPDRDL